jgi:hypothetical protein
MTVVGHSLGGMTAEALLLEWYRSHRSLSEFQWLDVQFDEVITFGSPVVAPGLWKPDTADWQRKHFPGLPKQRLDEVPDVVGIVRFAARGDPIPSLLTMTHFWALFQPVESGFIDVGTPPENGGVLTRWVAAHKGYHDMRDLESYDAVGSHVAAAGLRRCFFPFSPLRGVNP